MGKLIRFVSDTHGKILKFVGIVDDAIEDQVDEIIQVGDWGFGFGTRGQASFTDNILSEYKDDIRIGIIRGNHDNPREAVLSNHFIKDGTVRQYEGVSMMFVGGASSIDQAWRTPEVNWWEDEQLSEEELEYMVDIYKQTKPHIMVTHDAPEQFVQDVMVAHSVFSQPVEEYSRTRIALQKMFEYHKPNYFIFGHWHTDIDQIYEGTRFICREELGTFDMFI